MPHSLPPSERIHKKRAHIVLCVMLFTIVQPVSAAIMSTGDVKPPFALLDTVGSTKTFTVPNPNSTNGGVYIGDIDPGALNINNGWTLNSTFGIVANATTSSTPSESSLTLSGASTWNMTGDFDVGQAATASVHLSDSSVISVGGQTRLGTANSGNGLLSLVGSTLSSGSLIVAVAGGGQVSADGSSLNAGWIDVGSQSSGQGVLILSSSTVDCTAGLSTGLQGSGMLNVTNGTTLTTGFANFGIDYNHLDSLSDVSTSIGLGTISGAGTAWTNGSGLVVGYNTSGSLSIENSATVTSGWVEVSRWSNDGTLNVDNATMRVGQNGDFTDIPSFIVGTEASSAGTANVFGPAAVLTVTDGGFLQVARFSNSAVLNISAGAQVSTESGGVFIATEVGAIGTVNLDGNNTKWSGTGQIEIGRSGQGIVNIKDGANLSTATVRTALEAASINCSINLSDLNSQLNTTGLVSVGEKGSGHLVVAGGAKATIGSFLWLATEPNSDGTVEVVGSAPDPMSPGSAVPAIVASSDTIIVGGHGSGSVIVHQGAQLVANNLTSPTNSSAIIGWWPDAHGSVTVDGSNSLWTGNGTVNVGFHGVGNLTIQQGGRVQSVDGVIARHAGSTGAVILTGNNSVWAVHNSLYVGGRPESLAAGDEGTAGPGGTGLLKLGTGSQVSTGASLKLFDAGTVDVSGGGWVGVGTGSSGQAGIVDIRPDGGFTGSGKVVGNVLNSGVIAPGSPLGVLGIEGNYMQASAGKLSIEISGMVHGIQYDAIQLSGIAVIGGTLNVSLVNGFTPAVGDQFEIITANAVTGTFADETLPLLPNGLSWGIHYAASAVVLSIHSPGDFDLDGDVDGADFVAWQTNFPKSNGATRAQGDADRDGDVDAADFAIWQSNFPLAPGPETTPVPEPAGCILLLTCALIIALTHNRRK